jgi:hypothetical protein
MKFSPNLSLPLVGSPSEERFRTSRNDKNMNLLSHLSMKPSEQEKNKKNAFLRVWIFSNSPFPQQKKAAKAF